MRLVHATCRFLLLATFLATAIGPASTAAPAADDSPRPDALIKGRIAYSADGNHNDPDDWIASPVALAIFAEAGLKDRLVHFSYNNILPQTDPEWEKKHADGVLGAAARYGYDKSVFFDCRKDLAGAVASITKAVNASSAENPLYFIIAGPMEVPYLGIEKSDPTKRPFVYAISHSRWNDGYASGYKFTHPKRSVIEQGVHWVQICDQNRLLSFGRYGRSSLEAMDEFKPYFWMRDSSDPKLKFLWERMLVSMRPDPSDAGMAWFLATGDETCDPVKLRKLLEQHEVPVPISARKQVRLEAENFRHIDGFEIDDKKDKKVSHQLHVRLASAQAPGRLRTTYDEPFAARAGRFDVEVRYCDEKPGRAKFAFFLNGAAQGSPWESAGEGQGWLSQTFRNVAIKAGDEVRIDAEGDGGRLDYVQLNLLEAVKP